MTAFLQSFDRHDQFVIAIVFGLLALFLVASAYILWVQRRERENEFLLRVGMDDARRHGLIDNRSER